MKRFAIKKRHISLAMVFAVCCCFFKVRWHAVRWHIVSQDVTAIQAQTVIDSPRMNAAKTSNFVAPSILASKEQLVHVAFACDTKSNPQVRTLIAALHSVVVMSKRPERLEFHIFVRKGHERRMLQRIHCALPQEKYVRFNVYSGNIELMELPIKVRLERERRLRTPFNYIRFDLAQRLPRLQKILYLDTDIIAFDDVASIYDNHLKGSNDFTIAAAARDWTMGQSVNFSVPEVVEAGIRPGDMAFNAGVLLFHLDNWRKQNMTRRVMKWMELNTNKPVYPLGSQPPLQLSVGNKFEHIGAEWNVDGAGHSVVSKQRLAGAKILHWTGPKKGCERGANHAELWRTHDSQTCFRPPEEYCEPIEKKYWKISTMSVD